VCVLDVQVFNPFARFYVHSQLSKCYQLHEREKRRAYDECIREVEQAISLGPIATVTIISRKLVSMLADKRSINCSRCLFWLQCRLCFLLLRSSVMCLRATFSCPLTCGLLREPLRISWPRLITGF